MKPLLFGEFTLPKASKKEVLEKIKKYIGKPRGFFHIVSLNPENIVIALQSRTFKRVLRKASLAIIDGAGIELAARMLSLEAGERYPGVDLMNHLISHAGRMRLRVLLIGGQAKLALRLAQCYRRSYPKATFIGIQGFKNIKKPTVSEKRELYRIVRATKPQIVFAAFGSPSQEIWFEKHKRWFSKCVCMGVGGAFDYLSGAIQRPNKTIRAFGLEWLMRLVKQPQRWRRQLRLIKFMHFVIKQKVHDTLEIPQT